VNGLKEQFSGKVEFQTIDPDNEAYTRYQQQYGFQAVPTVIVLDSSGNVVLKETGISDEAAYEKTLTDALEKAGR
jgi:thioredoxin-like negative regulator of GroEL